MIEIAHNYSLQSLNTFGISSLAKHYIAFKTIEDITTFCTSVHVAQNHRYTLGYGSNTLFLGNFSGYVLHIQLTGIEIIKETIHYVWVKAAAGVNWHKLVEFCLSNGYGGIENLSLIPGSVGAAPIQNIGAYGVALQDSVDRVEAIEWSTGKKRIFTPSECEFGYRTSIFKTTLRNQYVITAIVLKLHKINFFSTSYGELEETLAQMKVKELSFKAIAKQIVGTISSLP